MTTTSQHFLHSWHICAVLKRHNRTKMVKYLSSFASSGESGGKKGILWSQIFFKKQKTFKILCFILTVFIKVKPIQLSVFILRMSNTQLPDCKNIIYIQFITYFFVLTFHENKLGKQCFGTFYRRQLKHTKVKWSLSFHLRQHCLTAPHLSMNMCIRPWHYCHL